MTPTPQRDQQGLTGLPARLATNPISGTVRGGVQESFRGIDNPAKDQKEKGQSDGPGQQEQTGAEPIMGYGDLLEADDPKSFKGIHDLVLRQEQLAINRLAQDTHWARVRLGYPWSRLTQNQDQSSWQASLPPGITDITLAAVPNKALDLCNKCVETLMADPPKPLPKPVNDSEDAEQAAKMSKRWLEIDGGEAGTNDNATFFNALDAATYRSSAFIEYWVDQEGGGYVPLQIKAHPQAQSPQMPFVGPDGMPTTDLILRYVTEDQGHGREFTPNPSEAEQVWQPKITGDVCYREHIRTYPEDKDIHSADAYIRLGYCTLGQARRRWKSVAALSPADQVALLDWQPTRYMVLLPAALRSRWKMGLGSDKIANQKGGSNDERLVFWYRYCRKACKDYRRGASIYASGALGGFTFERETLSAEVKVPATALQGQSSMSGEDATDLREMDLPCVQVRLIQDTEFRDPMGWPLIGRVAGSSEVKSQIIGNMAGLIDRNLNPASYVLGTSTVADWQVINSRATSQPVPILTATDKIEWEPQVQPNGLALSLVEYLDNQMDSAASSSKPAQGAGDQQEVSGVARKIAVQQANISMSRFNQAHLEAYSRHCRIKVQLAMAYYAAPQLIRYIGDDGSYKQEWWTGADFALVSDVGVQPGTGTMSTPQDKVNFAFSVGQMAFLDPGEAKDLVRSAIGSALGATDDVSQQKIERQISSWLEGPPEPQTDPQTGQPGVSWEQQKQAQLQQQQQIQAQMAPLMQQWQMQAQQAQLSGQPVPPQPQAPPVAPVFSCFAEMATDSEPQVADMRRRRLRKLIDSAKFKGQPPLWQQDAIEAYTRSRELAAAGQQQQQPQQKPQQHQQQQQGAA